MDLFSEEKTVLQLPNAELVYIPNFFTTAEADRYFKILMTTIAWQQDNINVFGKTYAQPRLTALYAANQQPYSYSNIIMHPKPFTPELLEIQARVARELAHPFTSVLLNLYRDGADSNGWHADNEKELGQNPTIASLSFGAERPFHFKHRELKEERHKLILEHGSLLVMRGEMQKHWLHQIAKTTKVIGSRINLTFRTLKE